MSSSQNPSRPATSQSTNPQQSDNNNNNNNNLPQLQLNEQSNANNNNANSNNSSSAVNLQTCSVQEYLNHTIYPYLNPGLSILDKLRPADPVEFLALYLFKSSSENRKNTEKLNEIYAMKTKLRQEMQEEHSVIGRV